MFSRVPRRSQASKDQIPEGLNPRNNGPKPKLQTLPEDDEPAGAAVAGVQEPAVEAEAAAVGPEAEREAPPFQRRTVQPGRLAVESQHIRVHDHGRGRFQSAGEQNEVGKRRHLFQIRRDRVALQGGREVERHDRARRDCRDEHLVTAALGHRHLTGERSLPVVVELPARELGLVGAAHGREERLFEHLAVVADRDLRKDDRQVDTAEEVGQELVALHLLHGLRRAPLELLGRDRHLAVSEEARQARQAFGEVHFRLGEAEVAVGVDHLGLHALRRDAPAVAVEQHAHGILDLRDLGAGDERIGDLLAAEYVQKRLDPSGPVGILCHDLISFRAESPKSVLPLPVAQGLLTTRSTL